MAFKTFAEIKAHGETLSDKERIAFLEDCVDWAMAFWKIEQDDRREAQIKASEAEKKLAEIKNAMQGLL